MLLLKDISTSQKHRKNSNYKAPTKTTHVKAPHVNMEHIDRWHLCECGLPFPRGLPIVAGLLVCPQLSLGVATINAQYVQRSATKKGGVTERVNIVFE